MLGPGTAETKSKEVTGTCNIEIASSSAADHHISVLFIRETHTDLCLVVSLDGDAVEYTCWRIQLLAFTANSENLELLRGSVRSEGVIVL